MANKSISQLTAGSAISGTDIFPDVQTAGVGPVKVTATQLGTYVLTGVFDTGFTYNTTSKSLTLGVQSTTAGSLILANANASAYATTVKSSDSASAAWTMTLPVSAGTNGYLLTTNGSGVTSWANPTALGIDLDIGTTAITSGTVGRLLFEGAGNVLQESANLTFSTAALTLGVQQTTQGTLVLANTAAGAFATTIQSSNSASAAWTLTLPTTAGTNGYILTTNGSGVSSWTNPTALGVDLDVGTTAITGGVTGRVLYDNAGVLGEYTAVPVGFGGTGTSTAFTAGSVVFAGASGVYSQDNANFFWDDTNNRLGIGLTNPSAVLNPAAPTQTDNSKSALFVSDSATTTKGVAIGYDASANYGHIQAVNKGVAYTNLGLQVEGGNVGIGTASPSVKLQTIGNIVAGSNAVSIGATREIGIDCPAAGTSSLNMSINGTLGSYFSTSTSSANLFAYGASVVLIFGTNNTERARIDTVGNLLLGGTAARGTTVGTAHLDLFNGTAPVGTLTNGISLYSSSGDFLFMDATGAAYKVGYRNIPQNAQTSAYVAAIGDVGEHISITTGGVTVNASIFSAGDVFTIYNNSGSSQNITAGSGVTFRLAGTATSGTPRTVAQYGLATVLCVTGGASPVFVLSGAGVA
jgi:hypothetical protein